MKLQQVIFGRPVKVLQVFRMINEYGKDQKSFANRKDQLVWKPVSSKNGYVQEGILYLPEAIQHNTKFNTCRLITIEDETDITPQPEWKLINGRYNKGNNHCFPLHHSNHYEIFTFGKDLEKLSLRYNSSLVGDPSRDNFTIATIEKDPPVEVKINGKLDTSRGRYYREQHYIFHYLGEFDRCCFLKDTVSPIIKTIPANRRTVDLLKPLW